MGSVPDTLSSLPTLGHRLPLHILDGYAADEPDRPFAYIPRSDNLDDGWEVLTFAKLSRAVNYVAHIVAEKVKRPSSHDEPFPTLGYMGPNDVRYNIITLACIKAGCKALLISPRNTIEGQLDLLKKTDCGQFWYAESFRKIVAPWINQREGMKIEVVPELKEWLSSEAPPYPYKRTWQEGRFDPYAVLHTSGSTGIPKPIIERQAAIMVSEGYGNLPKFHNANFMFKTLAEEGKKFLLLMPMFHAAGITGFTGACGLSYGLPTVYPHPNKPITPEITLECIVKSGADSAMIPPFVLEVLAQNEESINVLKNLKYICTGGGK